MAITTSCFDPASRKSLIFALTSKWLKNISVPTQSGSEPAPKLPANTLTRRSQRAIPILEAATGHERSRSGKQPSPSPHRFVFPRQSVQCRSCFKPRGALEDWMKVEAARVLSQKSRCQIGDVASVFRGDRLGAERVGRRPIQLRQAEDLVG